MLFWLVDDGVSFVQYTMTNSYRFLKKKRFFFSKSQATHKKKLQSSSAIYNRIKFYFLQRERDIGEKMRGGMKNAMGFGMMMLVALALVKESESVCVDTLFEARDSYGDPCDYYFEYPDECGGYDDVDFTASQMCCDCGGGFGWVRGSLDEEWDMSSPYCYDDTGNGELASDGNGCAGFFMENRSHCFNFDDSDFTASEMCCACGG